MRIAILLAGVLLAAGCRAPLEGAPCPCLSGYECSAQNVCILVSSGSPEDDAGDGDGEVDAAGGVPDASSDGGVPDADVPDSGGGEPDAGGGGPDASAAWYEQ
jgi:hypothetical protein